MNRRDRRLESRPNLRPLYNYAFQHLKEAHYACQKAATRDVLGMSHGSFAGVNRVLGLVDLMEKRIDELEAVLAACEKYVLPSNATVPARRFPRHAREWQADIIKSTLARHPFEHLQIDAADLYGKSGA